MTESSVNNPPDESQIPFDESQPLDDSQIAPEGPSLKRRVIRGSLWTLGGHFATQFLRLASNLIVSRLLFPKAFGLMGLVYTVISGLELLSDLGIQPNVIQSKRQDEQFLNTAWTLAILRGLVLWLGSCAIAIPVASFYQEPLLTYLLPIVCLKVLVESFTSTNLWIANRNLQLNKVTVIDVSTTISVVIIQVLAAWIAFITKAPQDLAIWALVVGLVPASFVKVLMSHFYIKGERNRLAWEPEAFQELQRFGKWIFFSSFLTFFALHGNNLLLPKLTSIEFFGVFIIALNLSKLPSEVLNMVNTRVLYPSYAELVRERPDRLYPALRRARLVLNGLNWGVSLFFILFGKFLIGIMYDSRFAQAGWILQLLAVGNLITWLSFSYMNVLMAQGKTFIMSTFMAIQVFCQFACVFAGYYFSASYPGSYPDPRNYAIVLGIAAVGWLLYPFQAFFLARLKIWQPEIDLPALAAATGIALLLAFQII